MLSPFQGHKLIFFTKIPRLSFHFRKLPEEHIYSLYSEGFFNGLYYVPKVLNKGLIKHMIRNKIRGLLSRNSFKITHYHTVQQLTQENQIKQNIQDSSKWNCLHLWTKEMLILCKSKCSSIYVLPNLQQFMGLVFMGTCIPASNQMPWKSDIWKWLSIWKNPDIMIDNNQCKNS